MGASRYAYVCPKIDRILRTGENESDLGRVYVDRTELHDFLATSRNYSQVLVKLHDYDADGEALAREFSVSLS